MIDPGEDYRLLEEHEIIREGECSGEVCISCKGEITMVDSDPYCENCLLPPEPLPITKPIELIDCGCKKHKVDPTGDLYAQHRDWVSLITECGTAVFFKQGIGISARREVEVLVEIQHEGWV